LACGDPPEGRPQWTLRLLADELVALDGVDVDSISPETVCKTLNKTNCNLTDPNNGSSRRRKVPSSSIIWSTFSRSTRNRTIRTARSYVDEHPTQLIEPVREPQPAELGRVGRENYHYNRVDTKNLLLASETLDGWRAIAVTDRRMTEDWVGSMQPLADEHYPDTECVRVVFENLSTHDPGKCYESLPAAKARRLLDQIEFHFTPVHGSWMNIA
jgi:hypothetical protein